MGCGKAGGCLEGLEWAGSTDGGGSYDETTSSTIPVVAYSYARLD